MQLIVKPDYDTMSWAAAKIVVNIIRANTKTKLGLATGSSPQGLYGQLVEYYYERALSFSRVETFNLDEYIGLPHGHPLSYRYFMETNLFKKVNIDIGKTNFPDVYNADLSEACSNYSRMLKENVRDVQILGLGVNGHIGFNEPGTGIDTKTHVVELQKSTILANSRFFNSIEEVPKTAITMGIAEILEAEKILLLVDKKTKHDALIKLLAEGGFDSECPVTALQKHKNLTVICTREAFDGN
ncbi:MAG: glucosamine-6-phosphate deaminase [Christensenellaceae bacterium]|jgi:glucosamine-6-phosphate deaminase|nr:glucosamine-6-phosphate deaminase [Christensenellaceae bacterium]